MQSLIKLASLFVVVFLIFSCGRGNSPAPATPASATLADFAFTGGNCTAPCEVSFAQKATGTITSYLWDFGDKTPTSTEANPKHTYQQGGTFTVTLTVGGPDGNSQPKTQQVTIKTSTTAGMPVKVWDKTFDGKDDDYLRSVITTSDGGFILGGYSNSGQGGDKSDLYRGGYEDYWVVKIDGNGVKVWDKTFGGSYGDYLRSVIATSDGGFLLGGYSASGQTGNKSDPNRGDYDYWVVKVDGRGTKVWDKTFGGTGNDNLSTLVATSDGGFLLGGSSGSGQTGNKSDPSRGGFFDYWVVKIDGRGNKVWDKTFGGTSDDNLSSMVATSDGGFLLGGTTNSDQGGNKSAPNWGARDFWVVKIDASGTKLWDKTFGGSTFDIMTSMLATSDGGFLLGGHSDSEQDGNKSDPKRGPRYDADYWVVKIDGSGTKVWDKTFGGSSVEGINFMAPTSDGGFLLGGYSNSKQDGNKSEPNRDGTTDYWVVKIDGRGTKVWDKTFGNSDYQINYDFLHSIVATSDGGFLLGGDSSRGVQGQPSLYSNNSNMWVVKIK